MSHIWVTNGSHIIYTLVTLSNITLFSSSPNLPNSDLSQNCHISVTKNEFNLVGSLLSSCDCHEVFFCTSDISAFTQTQYDTVRHTVYSAPYSMAHCWGHLVENVQNLIVPFTANDFHKQFYRVNSSDVKVLKKFGINTCAIQFRKFQIN